MIKRPELRAWPFATGDAAGAAYPVLHPDRRTGRCPHARPVPGPREA